MRKDGRGACTVLDDLFAFLAVDHHAAKQSTAAFAALIEREQFDTVSLAEDVDDDDDACNAAAVCSAILLYRVRWFLRDARVGKAAFSTGLVFWYHAYYKQLDVEQHRATQRMYDAREYGGHAVQDLFVAPRYASMQEEALNSGLVSAQEFREHVLEKSRRYSATEAARSIGCIERKDPLHFGIVFTAPLDQTHLAALILYTDFSALSTAFSATFRPARRSESLADIKRRHSRFCGMAKLLCELVQYFGRRGCRNVNGKERGPFFCGMSCKLHMGEFAVRLNGPTSTSKAREVAERFASESGTVMQLNNRGSVSGKESFFDCSWLSAFAEEEERLMMGGRYKLELEDIRVVAHDDVYRRQVRSLFLFHSMVAGDWPYDTAANEAPAAKPSDVRTVARCMAHFVGAGAKGTLHGYVKDTFHLFAVRRTQVIINLCEMGELIAPDFRALLVHSVEERARPSADCANLLKPVVFALFPSAQEVVVHSPGVVGRKVYAMDVRRLLCDVVLATHVSPSLRRLVIKDGHRKWLMASVSDALQQWMTQRGVRYELKTQKAKYKNKSQDEDVLIIHF